MLVEKRPDAKISPSPGMAHVIMTGMGHAKGFKPPQMREGYHTTIEPARTLRTEAAKLEHEVSDLVNAAYGLTEEEVALVWCTAPPRMPLVTG